MTYSISSSRIASFRKFSRLYSGQKKYAIREWEYSQEEIDRVSATLNSLLQSGLSLGDAFETTQFLRGELFTLVDCLLCYNYKTKTEQLSAISLFGNVVQYVVAWLRKHRDLFPLYYDGLANNELFLTDDNVALAMAWPELLLTFERLLGFDSRTDKLKTLNAVPKDYKPTNFVNKGNLSSSIIYMVDLFIGFGGPDVCLEILSNLE